MSYEHSATDQLHEPAPEQQEQTILDIVEERFWQPYTELIELREQHASIGLDISALDKKIEELDELYLSLGGAELTGAESDVNNAKNYRQAEAANSRFHRAQEIFYANLLKHDGIDTQPPVEVEVESKPEHETTPDSKPVIVETPKETEAKTSEVVTAIHVGDTVRNRPRQNEGEPEQEWSNEWKVVKILPPTDKVPKEVVVLELNGAKEHVGMDLLLKRQNRKKPESAEKEKKEMAPTTKTELPKKVNTPAEEITGTYLNDKGQWAVPSETEPKYHAKFLEALKTKLDEMVLHGRMTEEQAAMRYEQGKDYRNLTIISEAERKKILEAKGPNISVTHLATKDAFRFANTDPAIKEHDRNKAREHQLTKANRPVFGDDKTNKWFNDIMENTSISQAQKEYLLSFGPDGPQRDKIDANEIKRQLDAEGFDYGSIIAESEPEQPPLPAGLQAELGDARAVLGLEPSSTLSSDLSAELGSAREALGLPAEKRAKVGRALIKSVSRLPRKTYGSTRNVARKGSNWISSDRDTSKKSDAEKTRDEQTKKAGRKAWSLFSIEEKPKSPKQIKKKGLKEIKKLSKKSRK